MNFFKDIGTNKIFRLANGMVSEIPISQVTGAIQQGSYSLEGLARAFGATIGTTSAPPVPSPTPSHLQTVNVKPPQQPISPMTFSKDFDDGSQWIVDFSGNKLTQLRPARIPDNYYAYYRDLFSRGVVFPGNPQGLINQLQSAINQGQFSGTVDVNKLFPQGIPGEEVGRQLSTPSTEKPTITPTSDKVNTPIPTPSSGTSTTTLQDSLVKTAEAYAKAVETAQAAQATTKGQYDQLSSQISNLLGGLGSKTAIQAEAERTANLPALRQQLTDVNTQVAQRVAEYNALSTDIEGKPITMQSIIGAQAQIRSKMAAEIGLLQARGQALQGQLALAQDTANRAVDVQYQSQVELINTKIKQLDLIKDQLTAQEKITAAALEQQYKTQQNALSIQIANEKDKNVTLLNLMQKYVDADIAITDSLEEAMKKIKDNSAIYQKEIRPSATSELTPYQELSVQNQIEDNFRQNPAIKAYTELVNFGVPQVIAQYDAGTIDNVGDTILMRSLAKVTDPTTGVREEEYRTFEDAIGALGRLVKIPSKSIGEGRLTKSGRADMIRELVSRYDARLDEYNNQYEYYKRQAERSRVTIPPRYKEAEEIRQQNNVQITPEKEKAYNEMISTSTPQKKSGYWSNLMNAIFGK